MSLILYKNRILIEEFLENPLRVMCLIRCLIIGDVGVYSYFEYQRSCKTGKAQ